MRLWRQTKWRTACWPWRQRLWCQTKWLTACWQWHQSFQAVSMKSQRQAFFCMVQAMRFRVILSLKQKTMSFCSCSSHLCQTKWRTACCPWQSDLERLAREACARQKDQNKDLSLDFWCKDMPDFLSALLSVCHWFKDFQNQFVWRFTDWLRKRSQEMNVNWRSRSLKESIGFNELFACPNHFAEAIAFKKHINQSLYYYYYFFSDFWSTLFSFFRKKFLEI